MQDTTINFIEVLDWLESQYKQELNPTLTSVKLCQDEHDVWLSITKTKDTHLGVQIQQEQINLNFICECSENNPSQEDVPVFTPERDVLENAEMLFSDKITLMNTTPLFDK